MRHQRQPGRGRRLLDMGQRVAEAELRQGDAVGAVAVLGREQEDAARPQPAGRHRQQGGEIGDMRQHVGGEEQVVVFLLGRVAEKAHQVGGGQPVIGAALACLLEHHRRQVDAGQAIGPAAQLGPGLAGAAAELEACRPAPAGQAGWRSSSSSSRRQVWFSRPTMTWLS